MVRRWLAGIVCACAASGLTGCGAPRDELVCGPPPQNTWAVEVTDAGRVRWQTPLMKDGILGAGTVPLVVGSIAVFGQDDVVHALRLTDGHPVWSWSSRQVIRDLFQWQGLAIVYATGSSTASLTGLDAATGQVRWTRPIDIPADVAVTADGGLAMMFPSAAGDMLQVLNASDGSFRWSAMADLPPDQTQSTAMAASGTTVLLAGDGHLTSYDDQTGEVRWTDALTSIQPPDSPGGLWLAADAGRVYLAGLRQPAAGGQGTAVVLGINPVNGRVEWRFTSAPATTIGLLGPGLVSAETGEGVTWLADLSPATGRLRWRLVTTFSTGQTFFAGGQLIALPSTSDSGRGLLTAIRSADGHRAWQVTLPTPVSFPPLAVPGGLLVNAARVTLPC
jgi:outer membrane protein assembly factor BamB